MNEEIVSLLHKKINGLPLTEIENKDLENWISRSEHNRQLYDEIVNSDGFRQEIKQMLRYDSKGLWKKVSAGLPRKKNSIVSIISSRVFRYAAAAILLILVSIATFYMFSNPAPAKQQVANNNTPPHDVAPGSEKAVLILADGKIITLDNAANGELSKQGDATIVKDGGHLAYTSDNDRPHGQVVYNTIKTTNAQHISSVRLSDGSKIWLNAASSIHFPVSFTGNERNVEITGEVYFEIAKNPAMPFTVTVNGMKVEVLGTHFNINAYDNEGVIKTTLLEGAVKIVANGNTSFLKPGQQGILRSAQDDRVQVLSNVDLDEAVAWKNDLFSFKKQNLETIMRQVSRWYDVQVIFDDKISEPFVVTTISRDVPISKLLNMLEMAGGVHFEIDETGKKIIVRH